MIELKSNHLWDVVEEFLQPGQTYMDDRDGECPVRNTPDNIVAAMLEDLRALEAECERLRAQLDEQWTPLESEPGAYANGYEHKMCRRRAQ